MRNGRGWFPKTSVSLAARLAFLYNSRMQPLLHSLALPLLVFVAVFVILFLYQWLWILQPQSVGVRHFQEKRYEEAAVSFQKVLKRRPSAGVEADTRRRLADTLDVLGRPEEAAAERERAEAVTARNPQDALALQAQGDLLKRKQKYDEACTSYAKALAKTPALDAPGRSLLMAKLATTHHDAGRPDETLKWAKAALQSSPPNDIRRAMESMAGVASADQGDLEGAERHYRRALELAKAGGKPEEVSRSMATLAGIQYKRGQFTEAIASSQEARRKFADPSRAAFAVEAECLRDMGRFDEARAVMVERRRAPGFDQPWTERRMQALAALGAAWIETRAGQPEAALALLEQAREGFAAPSTAASAVWPPSPQGGDDKLLLWCDATKAHALAERGDVQGSRQVREDVLSRLPRFAQDRVSRMNVYSHLSRAAFASGDLAECQELLHQYLQCGPNPVGLPSAYHRLGEVALRLGETEQARDYFEQAVAPGIDSLDTRRARARLDQMGG